VRGSEQREHGHASADGWRAQTCGRVRARWQARRQGTWVRARTGSTVGGEASAGLSQVGSTDGRARKRTRKTAVDNDLRPHAGESVKATERVSANAPGPQDTSSHEAQVRELDGDSHAEHARLFRTAE
jgi:hypothetical protein